MISSQRVFSLTIVFFYEYTRGRSVLDGHVMCSPDSLILYSRSLCHVPPACVLVRSRSRLTCFSLLATHTDMDSRLVPGYLLVSRFPFCLVDSYTYISRLCLSPFVLSTRLPCLLLLLMPFLL